MADPSATADLEDPEDLLKFATQTDLGPVLENIADKVKAASTPVGNGMPEGATIGQAIATSGGQIEDFATDVRQVMFGYNNTVGKAYDLHTTNEDQINQVMTKLNADSLKLPARDPHFTAPQEAPR